MRLLNSSCCAIAEEVVFVPYSEHLLNLCSTFLIRTAIGKNGKSRCNNERICLSAGAVIVKNVPQYAIVGGIPAKLGVMTLNMEIM